MVYKKKNADKSNNICCLLANVTEALKESGQYENTILVISADNGGTFEHFGAVPGISNWPFRGFKYVYFCCLIVVTKMCLETKFCTLGDFQVPFFYCRFWL